MKTSENKQFSEVFLFATERRKILKLRVCNIDGKADVNTTSHASFRFRSVKSYRLKSSESQLNLVTLHL